MKKEPEKLRLFIALDVPKELASVVAEYERELPFWRWTDPKQMHMTMRFIGDTSPEDTEKLSDEFLKTFTSVRKVRYTHQGWGFAPNARKASSMHLKFQCSHALQELKERVDGVVQNALGLPPETRPFLAHVTIMRMRKPPMYLDMERLQKWANEFPRLPEPFAQRLVLYRSELKRDGSVYTPLESLDLEYL